MTWTLKIKATRTDTDTDFYTAKDSTQRLTDSDLAYVYTTYKETGKLVSGPDGTLSANELELTKTYVFRDHLKKDILTKFSFGALIGVLISVLVIIFLIQYYNVNSANEIKVEILKPLIGIFILWYLFFKKPKNKSNNDQSSFIYVGGISGISSIFIGATGPLIAPFFLKENRIFSLKSMLT